MEFVESFMKFSFQDDDIFRIEEDELVQSTDGIKLVSVSSSLVRMLPL